MCNVVQPAGGVDLYPNSDHWCTSFHTQVYDGPGIFMDEVLILVTLCKNDSLIVH